MAIRNSVVLTLAVIVVSSAVIIAIGLPGWEVMATDNRLKLQRMEFPVNAVRVKVRFISQLKLPGEAIAYKVKTKPVTEERMREIIRLLDMPDPDTISAESQKTAKDKEHTDRSDGGIKISRNGTEGQYNIPDRRESLYMRNDGIIVYSSRVPSRIQAPTEEESITIAQDFLKRSGLIPPGAKLQLIGVDSMGGYDAYDDGTIGPEITEEQTPCFWIIRGKGTLERSTVDVSVCAGGRICGLVLCVRDIEPYMKYPLKNQAEVDADLRAGNAFIPETIDEEDYMASAGIEEVEIESYRLAYIEPIHFERVQYIQPTLYLIGKAKSKAGKTKPIVCQAAAIKSDYTIEKNASKDQPHK